MAALKLSPKATRFTFDSFRSFRLTDSQAEAARVVESGASVWLWGTCGVGKTHLATAAAIETVNGGADVERLIVADLADRMRLASVESPTALSRLVSRLRSCDLLILDDLGAERPKDFVVESLFRVVDYRAEWAMRTIVTSNQPPSRAAEKIGARIHSRLLGLCESIKIEGHEDCPDARLASRLREGNRTR